MSRIVNYISEVNLLFRFGSPILVASNLNFDSRYDSGQLPLMIVSKGFSIIE